MTIARGSVFRMTDVMVESVAASAVRVVALAADGENTVRKASLAVGASFRMSLTRSATCLASAAAGTRQSLCPAWMMMSAG